MRAKERSLLKCSEKSKKDGCLNAVGKVNTTERVNNLENSLTKIGLLSSNKEVLGIIFPNNIHDAIIST